MADKVYTILIAEDDADIVELLKLYLENAGYHVLAAGDGVEAYDLLQHNDVDLALLDIMMPRMNGYELTKKIRENNNIPIIILSAKNQDSDKILGLDLGTNSIGWAVVNEAETTNEQSSIIRGSVSGLTI